jgi:hypothetical protein
VDYDRRVATNSSLRAFLSKARSALGLVACAAGRRATWRDVPVVGQPALAERGIR